MKPFPKIHDVYIGRTVLATVLLTWAVLLGLDVLLALASETGDIGKGNYGFATAVAKVAYTIPSRCYTLFPTAAVIGSLLGLGQLAASSELTALRAAGLSRRRIGAAVAAAMLLLTAVMVVNGETLAPWGLKHADGLKVSAKSKDMIVAQYSGLWVREGNSFLNAEKGEERNDGRRRWLELTGVRLYEFADDGRLESIAQAARAQHGTGGWTLHDVRRTWFEERAVTRTEALQERWESQLDDTTIAASVTRPAYLSSMELRKGIQYSVRNGLDAGNYEEQYWGRWFYPLNVLALCLAAIPFAFGSLRSGNIGKRLFIGIVFAVGFWLLQTQFVRLAAVYKFDYRIGYLLPPLLMLGVSWFLFHRRSG